MVKLALRVSRRFSKLRGRGNRNVRPKTFTSEESAKSWADKNGVKNYELKNLKSSASTTKKIQVVVNE